MQRLSRCEISEQALTNNFREFTRISRNGVAVYPVIKANAYGHGMVLVADILKAAGAPGFCVNELWEVQTLRSCGMDLPVVVLGYVPAEFAADLVELDAIPVVYSRSVVESLSNAAVAAGKQVPVIIKVETGTNRQGLFAQDALALAKDMAGLPGVRLFGLSTHFADIEDTTDHSFAMYQLQAFMSAVDAFKRTGLDPGKLSVANSAAAILWPQTHLDVVRLGIALYGMWPSKETFATAVQRHREAINLMPVITWKTQIAQVKHVDSGQYVGYGRSFRTTHSTKLAVIPVGYYDGYDRKASNRAHVLIKGVRCQVRGRVCMNMFMVDVTDVPAVKAGDQVVLLGGQGDERITAEDMASWFGTINYEVTTRINENIPRIRVK